MPLIENLPLPGYPLRVDTTLVGAFERGRMSVADHAVEPGVARLVFLVPPEIVVRVQIVSVKRAEFVFTVTINGRTVRERGSVGPGKTRIERAYPFSAFRLDPAAPPAASPAEEPAARAAGRGWIGRIPMPEGFQPRAGRHS